MSCYKVEVIGGDGCFTVNTITGEGCFTVVDNEDEDTPIDVPDNPIDEEIPVPDEVPVNDHPDWFIHDVWNGEGDTLYLWVHEAVGMELRYRLVQITYEKGFDYGIIGLYDIMNYVDANDLSAGLQTIDYLYGGYSPNSPLVVSASLNTQILISKISLTKIREMPGDHVSFWADDWINRGVYYNVPEEYKYTQNIAVYDTYTVDGNGYLEAPVGQTMTNKDYVSKSEVPVFESYDGQQQKPQDFIDASFVADETDFTSHVLPKSIFTDDPMTPNLTVPADVTELCKIPTDNNPLYARLEGIPDSDYYRIDTEADDFYVLNKDADNSKYIFIDKSGDGIRGGEITFLGKFSMNASSTGGNEAAVTLNSTEGKFGWLYDISEEGVEFGNRPSKDNSWFKKYVKIHRDKDVVGYGDRNKFMWADIKSGEEGEEPPHSVIINGAILTADGGHTLKQKKVGE